MSWVLQHPAVEAPFRVQGMGQVAGLAEAVAFAGIEMRLGLDAIGGQCGEHGAGLLGNHHGIEFALEEDHRYLDALGVQQRGALAIAFGVALRVADQPVEVVALELVGGVGQGCLLYTSDAADE